jgi:hypothetical protein
VVRTARFGLELYSILLGLAIAGAIVAGLLTILGHLLGQQW